MTAYTVRILQPGYSVPLGSGQIRANGTITLINGPKNIIVDTGLPKDRHAILATLETDNLSPSDIDFVVCTHGHSDHISNNNLFPDATFIVSYDVSHGDIYTLHDFGSGAPYRIDDDVEVVATPGHTGQDMSVLVTTEAGVIAIVGDLFECKDDIKNEILWRSMSHFPELQEASRRRIMAAADFIVPGHGEMFRI